jgi:hypothetical protein
VACLENNLNKIVLSRGKAKNSLPNKTGTFGREKAEAKKKTP